jgi:hypothetical protein
MKPYKVMITEKLQMTVEVEAENRMEAERLVHDKWNNGDFIFDAECFKGVDFKAVMPERERGAR